MFEIINKVLFLRCAIGKMVVFLCLLCLPTIAEDVLCIRPDEMNFKTALDGLVLELDQELTVFDKIIDKETTVAEFQKVYEQKNPKLVVLMEGQSLTLYKAFQQLHPAGSMFPPAFVFMTVYAEERIKRLSNATGIKYEIQAIQGLTALRSLLVQPMTRVGILYSTNLRDFFADQKQRCAFEKIELVGIEIDEKQGKLDRIISKRLKQLIAIENVDAIWILNDNVILKDEYVEWAWVPKLKDFKKTKPVMVSVEHLLTLQVGQFAVVPDHLAMGNHAARMILEIKDNNWTLVEGIRKPYSASAKLDSRLTHKIKLVQEHLIDEWQDLSSSSR